MCKVKMFRTHWEVTKSNHLCVTRTRLLLHSHNEWGRLEGRLHRAIIETRKVIRLKINCHVYTSIFRKKVASLVNIKVNSQLFLLRDVAHLQPSAHFCLSLNTSLYCRHGTAHIVFFICLLCLILQNSLKAHYTWEWMVFLSVKLKLLWIVRWSIFRIHEDFFVAILLLQKDYDIPFYYFCQSIPWELGCMFTDQMSTINREVADSNPLVRSRQYLTSNLPLQKQRQFALVLHLLASCERTLKAKLK